MKCPECKGKSPIRISADDVRYAPIMFSFMDLCPNFVVVCHLSSILMILLNISCFISHLSLFFYPNCQIMEPPWKAMNIMRKMDYPYEVSGI